MAYDNTRISLSPTGIDPTPFPRSSGVSRFDFTYADFAVAAEVATVKLLALPSDRQLLIRGAWVIVTEAASDAVLMGVGDEDARDGFLRDVGLDSLGTKNATVNRGAYFVNGVVPLLGDGTGVLGSVVDPTITLDLSGSSADLDTLTAGAWSVFLDYAWVDFEDHPANVAISKASVASPPPVAEFTRKATWKIETLSHTTAAINHDGVSSEDFTLTPSEPVFIVESTTMTLSAGTDTKQLTLDWYIDSGYVDRHPATKPTNFSPTATAFVFETDTSAGESPVLISGLELGDEANGRMYMRLSDANAGGGSGTYKLTVNLRVLVWTEV